MKKHYSGKASAAWWRAVERLPEPDKSAVYALGCALQELESLTARYFDEAVKALEGEE